MRRAKAAKAERLLEWVGRKYLLSVRTMRGPERFPHIVAARREFILLCKERNIGSTTIGKVLHRNQDTIRYHMQPEKFAERRGRYRARKAEAHAHPI